MQINSKDYESTSKTSNKLELFGHGVTAGARNMICNHWYINQLESIGKIKVGWNAEIRRFTYLFFEVLNRTSGQGDIIFGREEMATKLFHLDPTYDIVGIKSTTTHRKWGDPKDAIETFQFLENKCSRDGYTPMEPYIMGYLEERYKNKECALSCDYGVGPSHLNGKEPTFDDEEKETVVTTNVVTSDIVFRFGNSDEGQ